MAVSHGHQGIYNALGVEDGMHVSSQGIRTSLAKLARYSFREVLTRFSGFYGLPSQDVNGRMW
jgi:hypothetical protein